MDVLLGIAIPILGIAGLCTGNATLFLVAVVLIIIDDIIGFVSGNLKSLKTQIIAAVIGGIAAVLFDFNIFNAIVFALCMENALIHISGLAMMLIYGSSSKKQNRNRSRPLQSNNHSKQSTIKPPQETWAVKKSDLNSTQFKADMAQYNLLYDHLKEQNDRMNAAELNVNKAKIINIDGVECNIKELIDDMDYDEIQKSCDEFKEEYKYQSYLSSYDEDQSKPAENNVSSKRNSSNNTRLFCTKCGVHLPADAVFCHKCGSKVYKE